MDEALEEAAQKHKISYQIFLNALVMDEGKA
jgi:hypothetical protein